MTITNDFGLPNMVSSYSVHGFGLPNMVSSYSVHGSTLAAKQVDATKQKPYEPFHVLDDTNKERQVHISMRQNSVYTWCKSVRGSDFKVIHVASVHSTADTRPAYSGHAASRHQQKQHPDCFLFECELLKMNVWEQLMYAKIITNV